MQRPRRYPAPDEIPAVYPHEADASDTMRRRPATELRARESTTALDSGMLDAMAAQTTTQNWGQKHTVET